MKKAFIKQTLEILGEVPKVKFNEGATEEEAFAVEIAFIDAIKRRPNGPLTNLTDGGDGTSGWNHSTKTIEKIRKSHIGKILTPEHVEKTAAKNRGRKHSLKTRQQMSDSHSGKKHTQEAKDKISVANSGRPMPDHVKEALMNANAGRVTSQETKDKLSTALKGIPKSQKTRDLMSEAQRNTPREVIERRAATKRGQKLQGQALDNVRASNLRIAREVHLGSHRSEESKARMKAAQILYQQRRRETLLSFFVILAYIRAFHSRVTLGDL